MSIQKTTPPRAGIWTEIATKQAELQALYAEAGLNVFKETEGEAFLGEKNTFYSTYWHSSVKKHPLLVKGSFNIADYGVKNELFPYFVAAYNGHNAACAVLNEPYNILSKDLLRYGSDARKGFDDSKDAVHKQIIKDAPAFRKQPKKKSKATDKTTETPKID